jgi:uncharacterized phiE125 gp8 family phage protein
MKLVPIRTVAPDALFTLDEVKAFCRVDHDDDDLLLASLSDSAVGYFDGYSGILGRCLVSQTWRQDLTGWADVLHLPFAPASIVSVTYLDGDGAAQTVSSADYEFGTSHLGGFVRMRSSFGYPALQDVVSPVSVTFTTGYGNAAAVPPAIKTAALMHIAWAYDSRNGDGPSMPDAIHALVSPYRLRGL